MSKGKEKKKPEKSLKQKRLDKRSKRDKSDIDVNATIKKKKVI